MTEASAARLGWLLGARLSARQQPAQWISGVGCDDVTGIDTLLTADIPEPPACEVEVKYRIGDLPAVEEALGACGAVLSPPVVQDDQAYARVGWVYGQSKIGVPFARLRTERGRHLLTVKTPVANELSCVEHETEVADRQQMDAALRQMGFYPTVRIRKSRRTAALGPMSLCLDEVDDLGAFLEIEQIVAAGEQGERVQADLDRFAATLGVSLERITDTYDSLIRAGRAGPGELRGQPVRPPQVVR
ncbi:adenylate cyclase, class 2 [Micromonospora yangpuensis]|uniref:Adenylate cyclase, class 2 n=1 Tax=Micromonospora yangpuensis TaxID=683228 RepID=A0A1C6UK67_9ACTN|nr:adenylate cyclase, class 2 [Micromonospora yangpuensis]